MGGARGEGTGGSENTPLVSPLAGRVAKPVLGRASKARKGSCSALDSFPQSSSSQQEDSNKGFTSGFRLQPRKFSRARSLWLTWFLTPFALSYSHTLSRSLRIIRFSILALTNTHLSFIRVLSISWGVLTRPW